MILTDFFLFLTQIDIFQSMRKELYISALLTLISVFLIISGFYCPPMGEINGSVLTAVGELFAFATLWNATVAVCKGKGVNFKHGRTEININDDEKKS